MTDQQTPATDPVLAEMSRRIGEVALYRGPRRCGRRHFNVEIVAVQPAPFRLGGGWAYVVQATPDEPFTYKGRPSTPYAPFKVKAANLFPLAERSTRMTQYLLSIRKADAKDEELYQHLRRMSYEQHVPVAEIVRRSLWATVEMTGDGRRDGGEEAAQRE